MARQSHDASDSLAGGRILKHIACLASFLASSFDDLCDAPYSDHSVVVFLV
jgi:hypothetical protein